MSYDTLFRRIRARALLYILITTRGIIERHNSRRLADNKGNCRPPVQALTLRKYHSSSPHLIPHDWGSQAGRQRMPYHRT